MQLWWQWALVFLAAFLVGLSKTGITGLGILAVAIFASVLPPRESVGTVLVTLLAGDVMAVSTYRREADWRYLWRLFPWTAIGVVLGAFALGRIDDTGIRRLIGGILVVLIVLYVLRQSFWPGELDQTMAERPWIARATGILAGFTTMVANASGPIMTLYLLALRLPKVIFIGTTAWFFFVLNLFKVPFSVGLGLISASSLLLSLQFIPFTIVGALLGRWILPRINQQLFERLALALTLVAGVRLLF